MFLFITDKKSRATSLLRHRCFYFCFVEVYLKVAKGLNAVKRVVIIVEERIGWDLLLWSLIIFITDKNVCATSPLRHKCFYFCFVEVYLKVAKGLNAVKRVVIIVEERIGWDLLLWSLIIFITDKNVCATSPLRHKCFYFCFVEVYLKVAKGFNAVKRVVVIVEERIGWNLLL